jgi:CelD/BcsL family acetyltransferase involved in cellulose biosynthesis
MDGPQCPYLKIDSNWEEFYRKRKKRKFRYNINRARKQLEGLGAVEFKTLKTWEDIERYLPQMFEIHRKRWKGYYTGSRFSTPSGQNFYKKVAEEYQAKGWLDIAILLLNGQVIAYSYSFIWGGEYFYYNPAHDPKFSDYSPGTLLLIYILEKSFNSRFKRFDFGRGDLFYKSYWADDIRQNKRLIFSSQHLKGEIGFHLYLIILRLRDYLRKSAFLRGVLFKLSFLKNR